jgi:hypothetical protein
MPKHWFDGKYTEPKIDTHELAWAAGFFDGEGSVGFYTKGRLGVGVIRITISQKNKLNLKRFRKSVLGVGKIYDCIGIYKYTANKFEETQSVMSMIWKYLGSIKREQYANATREYIKTYENYHNKIKRVA